LAVHVNVRNFFPSPLGPDAIEMRDIWLCNNVPTYSGTKRVKRARDIFVTHDTF